MKTSGEWKSTPLGSVLERVALPVRVEPSREYRQIGIRSHGKGIFHKLPVTGESLGEKRVFWVVPDALVLNIVFAWEQAVAVTSTVETGMIASHRFPMYRPVGDSCNVNFLLQCFRTPKGKELLELASPGGAGRNKTLGQREFERLKLSMPCGSEQTRIATAMTIWDQSIHTLNLLLANSRKQKQALIEHLVSGRRRLNGETTNWSSIALKQVASIFASSVDKKHEDGELPVRLCNYTDVYHNDYIMPQMPFMAATATESEIAKYSVHRGDVLITKDSETANDIAVSACVVDEIPNLVCGYHLAILRPDRSRVVPEFLHCFFGLRRTRAYFASHANGVTRFGLPIHAVEDVMLTLPSVAEQNRIVQVISANTQEIAHLAHYLKALKTEKKALMQQLLTGKRRLREPQFAVKAAP